MSPKPNPPTGDVPPHDRAAEAAVLAALLRCNDLLDDIRPVLAAEDFFYHLHQHVYRAVCDLIGQGVPADLVTVYAELKARQLPDFTPALLAEIWEADPTGANGRHHARLVRDHAVRRRLIHLCRDIAARAADTSEPPDELVAEFESDVFAVADTAQRQEPTALADAAAEVFADLQAAKTGTARKHIPTGLHGLDAIIGGLHPGRLVIVAARPSVGKSAIGLHFALNAACCGFPALVVSLEMAAKEWAARALARNCGVALNHLTGTTAMDDPTARRLLDRSAEVRVPVWVDDRPGHTVDTIAAVARRACRKHGVKLLVVDYLQLIEHAGYKSDNLATRIGNTSRRLKLLARQLGIPVVCLAQLNREVEKRGDGRPQLSDLRDSGAVEQDADDVYLLWPQNPPDAPGYAPAEEMEIRVCVDKQRNGPRAVVPLTYVRRFVRFDNRTPHF